MHEHETESGLLVLSRSVMPRDFIPNDNGPGPNTPAVSVGPTSSEGFGNTNVLFNANLPAPLQAQAWSGWPVGWDTPSAAAADWMVQRTSTVGTCSDTIGRTISTFDPYVKRQRPNQPDELVVPQPLWTTNPEPLLYASFDEWIRSAVNSLLIAGELFVYCTGRNAEAFPVRWVNLNPDHVIVKWRDGALGYDLNGVPLPAHDVLHVKYQAVPGELRGIGPLAWIARNILTADALAQFAKDLADRGGVPWATINVPHNVNATQASELLDQFLASRATRGMAPAVLGGGTTMDVLSFSPESMALLSLREFDEQRIAAGMGCPPLFVGLPSPSGLNYTSTQMLADFFYLNTLKPLARNIANAVSGWALPRGTNLCLDASEYTAPASAVAPPAPVAPPSSTPEPMPNPMGVTQ